MGGQERQDVELLGGQFDPHPGPGHFAMGEVEVEGAHVELVDPVTTAPAPQRGTDPGVELTHPEGFGDVIVGSLIECVDLAGLGTVGGQHDDGDVAVRPDGAAHLQAVGIGQSHVEDDDIRAFRAGGGDAFIGGLGRDTACPRQ